MKNPITHDNSPQAISEILRILIEMQSSGRGQGPPDDSRSPNDDLLNVKQAAELLQIAVPTLYGKVSKRQIPHIKKHKRLLFHRSELLQYLDSGRRKTAEEQEAFVTESVDAMLQKAGKSRKIKKP